MEQMNDTWVVDLHWSQTDHENVLVKAKTREEAQQKVRDAIKGGWVMGARKVGLRLS